MGTKYISRKKNRRGNWVKYRDDRLVTAQQSTGAAQIANLKYILKNGSTGEFVEALDSIINERVRVALGQLVNNLDKGTGLAKVLGIDASNDLGASSIANLASVLSGQIPHADGFFKRVDISSSFINDIVSTFNNTGQYQSFDGQSMDGLEGRWVGYKHSDYAGLMILYGSGLYYGQILGGGSNVVIWSII